MVSRDKRPSAERPGIPSHILEAIGRGECTLFLGAGASNVAGAPSGEGLGDLITDKFLNVPGWKGWGLSLASAVSLACAQPGNFRPSIVTFVKDKLSKCDPSPAHLKIPWFRWRAIVTTNYDLLIEGSYDKESRRVQELIPVLKEEDLPDIGAAGYEVVPLLKPHGSISQKNDMALSLEDIYEAKKHRRLLFTYIEVLHLLGPVIYIGYSFKDVHILDMIYDITARLGPYRKPILFVTLQGHPQQAAKERSWIEGALKGIYSAQGFEGFMDALPKEVTPAIVPSMIARQMAPCRTMTFASGGRVSDTGFCRIDEGKMDEWEYWLTYSINDLEGYAGVIFERRERDTIDISRYDQITFELSIPAAPREKDQLEIKLESTLKRYEILLDVRDLKGDEWKEVKIRIDKKDVPKTSLRRVILADNGQLAKIGREYKIGLRKIKFE